MRITRTIASLLLTFLLNWSYGYQETQPDSIKGDKEINLLDSVFVSGVKGFNEIFGNNNRASGKALFQTKTEGLLIYEISVDAVGQVSVRFMTKLNDEIEESVTSIITATANGWLNLGKPYKIYQPLFFSLGTYDLSQIGSLEEFPSKFRTPFLRPSGWTAIASTPRVTRTEVVMKPGDARTREQVARELVEEQTRNDFRSKPKSLPKTDGATMKEYNKELKKFEGHMKKEKYKRAYFSLNKIIRYNPFDKSLIQQRRRLEKQLGKDEYRVYDILWLQAMEHMASIQNKKP